MQKVLSKNSTSLDFDTCIAKNLSDAIEEYKSPIKPINGVTDLDTQLFKEIYLVTSGGVSGEYLQAVYSYLGTIISTSVGILSVDLLIRSTHRFDELLSMST